MKEAANAMNSHGAQNLLTSGVKQREDQQEQALVSAKKMQLERSNAGLKHFSEMN